MTAVTTMPSVPMITATAEQLDLMDALSTPRAPVSSASADRTTAATVARSDQQPSATGTDGYSENESSARAYVSNGPEFDEDGWIYNSPDVGNEMPPFPEFLSARLLQNLQNLQNTRKRRVEAFYDQMAAIAGMWRQRDPTSFHEQRYLLCRGLAATTSNSSWLETFLAGCCVKGKERAMVFHNWPRSQWVVELFLHQAGFNFLGLRSGITIGQREQMLSCFRDLALNVDVLVGHLESAAPELHLRANCCDTRTHGQQRRGISGPTPSGNDAVAAFEAVPFTE